MYVSEPDKYSTGTRHTWMCDEPGCAAKYVAVSQSKSMGGAWVRPRRSGWRPTGHSAHGVKATHVCPACRAAKACRAAANRGSG